MFTGTRVPEVELIGEPGMPDAVASQLLEELLAVSSPLTPTRLLDAMSEAMEQHRCKA